MDIEWCIENGEIFIVQARPVTTIREQVKPEGEEEGVEVQEFKVLTKGMPASPGIASGNVKHIKDETELDKVKEGDILVTVMTTPDMVPAMRRANAIVTDEGGMTCHAAIVSRELGIPCVVGTNNATEVLADAGEISVDGLLSCINEWLQAPPLLEDRSYLLVQQRLVASPIVLTRGY